MPLYHSTSKKEDAEGELLTYLKYKIDDNVNV